MIATSVNNESNERHGIILSLASIGCFSATGLLLSYGNKYHGVDGWTAAAYRGVLGMVLIHVFQSRTGKVQLSHILTNRLLFLRGVTGGVAIPIFYLCIIEIGPGRAGIITGSYPLFASILAMLLIKERVRKAYGIYITIALFGLVGVFSDDGIEGAVSFYDALALLGAVFAGSCVVLIRHLRHTENTSNIFAAQCVFTLVISLCVAREAVFISDPAALGITVLAAVTVVGGQLCITESFRYINVAKGSTLQMLTPVTTCVFSALLLGEHFSVLEVIGGAAVLFASYKIALSKASKA